jgi:hypothetical protein
MIEVLAMSEPSLLEKLVLEEMGGKNQAIHAYDSMFKFLSDSAMNETRRGF